MVALPLDAWEAIISDHLTRDEQRVLLNVNRALHAIACRRLFKILHIYFGAWETLHEALNDMGYVPDQDGQALARSLAILDHVTRSHVFAASVHTVVIHAHMKGPDIHNPPWHLKLANAVRAIPGLRHLAWYGTNPQIPNSLLNALADSKSMESLRFPPRAAGPDITQALNQLTHLRSLRINWTRQVDSIQGYWLKELTGTLERLKPAVINNIQNGTLRHLCAYSELFLAIPVESLHTLTRLDIWTPTEMAEVIRRVFDHTPNLRSLTLACVDFDDMSLAFRQHSDALPALRMFKLMSLDPVNDEAMVEGLVEFLKVKPALERIDTNLPGLDGNAFRALTSWMRDRDGLRMVGIDARGIVDPEEMEFFAEHLPPNVVALHIQSCWENLPVDAPEFQPLIQCLEENQTIRLLHFQAAFDYQVLAAEYLSQRLSSLKYVGCGSQFWEIVNDDNGGRSCRSMKRSHTLRNLILDIEGLEDDWWWLMGYHDLYDLIVSEAEEVSLGY